MSAPQAPRANRNGDPCPSWCATDHGELLIPAHPVFGHVNGHVSDPMTGELSPTTVKVYRSGLAGEAAVVAVDRPGAAIELSAEKADMLACILECLPGSLGTAQLIDELRAAAEIARDTGAPHGGAR